MALKLEARKALFAGYGKKTPLHLDVKILCTKAMNKPQSLDDHRRIVKDTLFSALSPLSVVQGTLLQPRGPTITSLDSWTPEVATDIAPYIRSIVAFDMKLEAQRLQMSTLLSQGGRKGKKQRTTRSSLAALEGGSKASTRRERWFPNSLNLKFVMETGGHGWAEGVVNSQEHADTNAMTSNVEMRDASDASET